MANIRRYYVPYSIIFITTVTKNRKQLFLHKQTQDLLYLTIENAMKIHSFEVIAEVLLPEHFHLLIQITNLEDNFSNVIKCIKGNFTANYKKSNKITGHLSLWQPKFWDHVIRNELDLKNHLDYIHWNPVKHGYVNNPGKWVNSSIHKWINEGYYSIDWGASDEPQNIKGFDFE
jgi:putative transposase